MAEGVYWTALDAFLLGQVNLLSDTIAIQLAEATPDFDPSSQEFLADVSAALLGSPEVLPGGLGGKTISAGVFNAADVLGMNVANGDDVGCLYVFVDTGNPATSRLLCRIDRRSDSTPLVFTGNGTDVDVRWHPTGIFSI